MSYSIDSSVADCYPGTTCLVNKKGIKEEALLSEYEAFVTTGKAAVLSKNPIEGKFNFEHYKAIHRFLFEDIYDWAGQIRTTDLAKKNPDSYNNINVMYNPINEKGEPVC